MGDLISRSALIEELMGYTCTDKHDELIIKRFVVDMVRSFPTVDAVPLSEIYRVIAGHSYYHGDNILAALTCISEGKEGKPIKPIDVVPVVHGEWIRQNDGRSWTHYTFKCSNCGGGSNHKENFCPNCGADMRKKV